MDELISTGKILFVIFFVVATLVGLVLIVKNQSILGGTGLISLSLFMLLILFWSEEFDKLGWTPLWILGCLIVVSFFACLVPLSKKSTRSSSNDSDKQ